MRVRVREAVKAERSERQTLPCTDARPLNWTPPPFRENTTPAANADNAGIRSSEAVYAAACEVYRRCRPPTGGVTIHRVNAMGRVDDSTPNSQWGSRKRLS